MTDLLETVALEPGSRLALLTGRDSGDLILIDEPTGETFHLSPTSTGRDLAAFIATLPAWLGRARDEQVALFMRKMDDLAALAQQAKSQAGEHVVGRMDRRATWTITTPYGKMTAPSPSRVTTYDAEQLHDRLLALAADGVIDLAAVDAAVQRQETVTYTARSGGIARLRKLGEPRVDYIIDACSTTHDRRDRRVSFRAGR